MLLNLSILLGAIFILFIASILLWIKWRKINLFLFVLLITILSLCLIGVVKYSFLDSTRFDSNSLILKESDSDFVSHGQSILFKLKSWNRILRGKKPIYTTSGGVQIIVDPIGEDKSIKLFKRF